MQMAFESAAAERLWAKRGRHPRKKDGSGPVITATDAPPVVALDSSRAIKILIRAAEKNIGCRLHTADFSEFLIDCATREGWSREKVMASIVDAFVIVAGRREAREYDAGNYRPG